MRFEVQATVDSREGLAAAGEHLRSDPLRNNVILTLLESGQDRADMRFWWVTDHDRDEVVGALYQGPMMYPGVLSALTADCGAAFASGVATSIESATDSPMALPLHRVRGVACDAAAFAGEFSDRTHQPGFAHEAFRMLVCPSVTVPDVDGTVRDATADDLELLTDWTMAFVEAIGDPATSREGAAATIGGRLDRGSVVLWEVGDIPVSMASAVASTTSPVTRVGLVYTPREHQRRGYAAAVTAALTGRVLDHGRQAMLLTQLANPTSNAVYRSIGYRVVAEETIYQFGT